ncbi:DUF4365 domain-containing protein [Acinetobacter sp. SH20PTE14]|uniref:DUF4365 domain-containing protein n=1 Tax=Acinetobacter sp. SH20PTE14 TaxID=2905879 RepID=UPI003FA35F41
MDVQLKCTASDQGNEEFLKFPLPLKNYNDLRDTNIVNPRYLFVLIVPDNCNDWLIHQNNQTILQHCCYYYSLYDQPIVNNTTSVTVSIPRSQKLNTKSMIELLEYASNGMSLENRS